MNNAKFFRWLKYVLATTVVFVAAGFLLQLVAEGRTPAEAWDILLAYGLYQSALYAIVVATILTMK